MIGSGKLLLAALIGVSSGFAPAAFAANKNFVQLKFFCRSATQANAGFKVILVEAASCSAARRMIQGAIAMEAADPCHAQDADTWTDHSEEIQVKGCARQ